MFDESSEASEFIDKSEATSYDPSDFLTTEEPPLMEHAGSHLIQTSLRRMKK